MKLFAVLAKFGKVNLIEMHLNFLKVKPFRLLVIQYQVPVDYSPSVTIHCVLVKHSGCENLMG